MGSLFGGGGGGSAQAVKPPKPLQINIPEVGGQMTAADQAAYGAGDKYMQQYYPSLWGAQQGMTGQVYRDLTGPLNPTLENTLVNTGNMQGINALGGGDQGFGLAKGSLARNAAAANVATNTQTLQDTNRQLQEQMNQIFAPRSFGPTPEDVANMFTFNNTQMNNYLQQKFAGQTQAYYANQGAAAASGAAGTSAVAGILSAVIQAAAAASDERLKVNIAPTGKRTSSGIPEKTFEYIGSRDRFRGFIAQDVERVDPQSVWTDPVTGFKMVTGRYLPERIS